VGRHFNVMAMGERVVSENIAKLMVEEFLRTSAGKKDVKE
jgi:ribose 5-phosphate isomerase RpiB